jgi:excisionase family DNA binding protein
MLTSSTTDVEKLAYNADEAARAIGLSVRYIRELVAKGKLRSVKVGKRRLISTESLRKFVNGEDAA